MHRNILENRLQNGILKLPHLHESFICELLLKVDMIRLVLYERRSMHRNILKNRLVNIYLMTCFNIHLFFMHYLSTLFEPIYKHFNFFI